MVFTGEKLLHTVDVNHKQTESMCCIFLVALEGFDIAVTSEPLFHMK